MNEYELEQVECAICHRIMGVGYLEKTGRIVCQQCVSKQQKHSSLAVQAFGEPP